MDEDRTEEKRIEKERRGEERTEGITGEEDERGQGQKRRGEAAEAAGDVRTRCVLIRCPVHCLVRPAASVKNKAEPRPEPGDEGLSAIRMAAGL
jgi:hypothetical protein